MREKIQMNRGWRFFFGEPSYLKPRAEVSDQTYRGSRAANARGPARRDFDDRDWDCVSLPHDFVALRGISETDAHGGEHFDFPMDRGSAWYRRYFMLDEADRGRRIVLHFEGMGTFCEVYVNSMLLMTHRTNGIGFDVDITDAALFGYEQNVVAVHCDCHDFEAWYYEGGGITRNVWLVKTDLVSVDLWGTFVRSRHLSGTQWELLIDTDVRNDSDEPRDISVRSVIRRDLWDQEDADLKEPDGPGAETETDVIPARSMRTFTQRIVCEDPALWSPEHPFLYRLFTEVLEKGSCRDRYETSFGIREIRFDKDHGMFLNGKPVTIYGFANHMLYLGVGEAMTPSMCEYQIRTLREMGSNGYRTAHSPHQEDIMTWCDRYGQLVLDENRIFHSSEMVKEDVARLIRRDRNHPSVCMWSVYNEEDFVTTETGKRIFRTLKALIRKLDPTRPVSGATSYGMYTEGAHEDYDLFGFNHQTMNLDALHHLKPDLPIFCSEMIFPLGPKPDFSGLSVRAGEDALQLQKEYMIGGFHFTAWGYGPYRPHIIGMEGTPGTGFYGFKAYLRPHEPFARICPGWDFPGCAGKEVSLNLANNGDSVEIYLNGRCVKTVATDLYAITPVTLPYEPGELHIIAYKDGRVWAEDRAVTPGVPAGLELVCENRRLPADGSDAAIVSAYLIDADGNRCLHETGRPVCFSCNAGGELITTLSLRSDLYQRENGPEIRSFDGKCQALFRSLEGTDTLLIRAESPGLAPAELLIRKDRPAFAQLPVPEPFYVNGWRISCCLPETVDLETLSREHLTERFLPVDTLGTPFVKGRQAGKPLYYAYYTETVVPDLGENGEKIPALRFEGIDGEADILIQCRNKSLSARGRHDGDSPWGGHYRPELIVSCEGFCPGDPVEIWVLMRNAGRVHGIGWPVHWMLTTAEEIQTLDEKTRREWSYWKYGAKQ